jgi:hypothetical protein
VFSKAAELRGRALGLPEHPVAVLDCTPGSLSPDQMLGIAETSIEGITEGLLLPAGERRNG